MRSDRPEFLRERVFLTLAILLGLAFAVYGGMLTGRGQYKFILEVVAAGLLTAVAIRFQTRLWILIPLASGLEGYIASFPIGLPVRELVMIYAFGAFLLLKAFKIVKRKPVARAIDLVLLLNLLYLASTFVRNPVGALGFQSDRIGGRPYFQIIVAYLGYWVLRRVTLTPKLAWKLPAWMIVGPCLDGFAGFFASTFPTWSAPLAYAYSGFAPAEMRTITGAAEAGALEPGSRLEFLASPGSGIARFLAAYFDLITLFNPLYLGRFLLFLTSVIFILLSGFRSAFFEMGLMFVLASYLRNGIAQVVKTTPVLIAILAVLILGQGTLFNLPVIMQRTLSFLPGNWDANAIQDARDSVEWRTDMWKDAVQTDRYIRNKIFGDGFGVERSVLEAVQFAEMAGIKQWSRAEGQAIMGIFHNGPLSTIRVVGYIGMVFYIVLICMTAQYGWRLSHRTKGTPFFPLTLMVAIPAVIRAISFFSGGGFFDIDLERTIFTIGMLKMIEASLAEEKRFEVLSKRLPANQLA